MCVHTNMYGLRWLHGLGISPSRQASEKDYGNFK